MIIVTTRQGVTSKPSVTAKAEFGVSKLARDLDLMDAQEFVRYLNDRNYFSSRDPQRPPRFDPSEYGARDRLDRRDHPHGSLSEL